jgi:DNA-binding ferritin-like protein
MKQSKTLKSRSKKRNTRKQSQKKSVMVKTFMEILAMIKLYHWKTHSYSQHKATDDLYAKLNENIDKFVETLLGKSNSRIQMLEKKMNMYDLDTKTELRERLFEFREFLVDMNQTFDSKRDSDLLNIRDEILGDVNQFLYLLTFDQP